MGQRDYALGEPEVGPPLFNPRPWRAPSALVTTCANCDATFRRVPWSITPYCGLPCRAVAKAVRYARQAHMTHGQDLPNDVGYAVWIKTRQALGGGYRDGARHVPQATRRAVWQRDHERCVLCGQPGEQIDHIGGDSPDPANLRLLCEPCHGKVTDAHLRPLTEPERALLAQIESRIDANPPLRPCDDDETWDSTWRTWLAEHTREETDAR